MGDAETLFHSDHFGMKFGRTGSLSNNLESVVEQKQTVRTDWTHTEPHSSFFHTKRITELTEIKAKICE